jgi:hypothetical protein
MKKTLLFFCLLSYGLINAQETPYNSSKEQFLETLFNSGKTYAEIEAEGDKYFRTLYPGLSRTELCEGEHRDGVFVKYQRWKSFWKYYLNSDGTLADFSSRDQLDIQKSFRSAECSNFDFQVSWENISHESGLGWGADLGKVSCMAFHPTDQNIFYVGAAWGGLWKTLNGGQTYELLNDNLPLSAISSIVIDPNNPERIAVALGELHWYNPSSIGVFVSEDGGQNFSPTSINWPLNDDNRIFYMDQDPTDGQRILIASSEGLLETNDFFNSYTSLYNLEMHSVKFSRTSPGTIHAGGRSGQFYRSTDNGNSFNLQADFGDDHVRIAVPLNNVNGTNRVVAAMGTSIYISEDNGASFADHELPDNESNVVIEFAGNDNQLNLGHYSLFSFEIDDPLNEFTPLTDGYIYNNLPYAHVDQRNVFTNPLEPGAVYFCNDGGITRSNIFQNEITNLSDGLIITQFYDIAVSQSDENGLAGGTQDNGSFYRLNDGSWIHGLGGDGMGQEIDPEDSGIRYSSVQFGILHKWENGALTNIKPPQESEAGAWETPFKLDPNDPSRVLIAFDSVYVSEDRGDNWTVLGGSLGSGNLNELAIAPSNSERVYVTRSSTVFVKSENSDQWIARPSPVNQWITDIEVDEYDEDVVYISYGGYSGAFGLWGGYNEGDKVYRSTDAGLTWSNISGNLPDLPVMSLELYYGSSGGIFIGMHGAVYYSSDPESGEWQKYGCLPATGITDIEIQYNTNSIFVGTHGRGIFKSPIEFNVNSIEEENPMEMSLYPNPTTDKLTVLLDQLEMSNTSIQLTDISGRLVIAPIELFSNDKIEVDCSRLASGHYFISIIQSDQTKISSSFKVTN